MQLSTRLAAVANFVNKGSKVIDVGTDHAYIPIHLIQTGKAVSCLATDINKGPLEKAHENIMRNGLKCIRLKQTNGLQGLDKEDADTIMISGMGGFLIVDILKNAPSLVKKVKHLVLQPQQDSDEVRKYLHQIGFRIEDEAFVKDEDKYYTVISAIQGEESYKSPKDYKYGKCLIEKKDATFKEWVDLKLSRQQSIYQSIEKQNSTSAVQRKKELQEEITLLQEVRQCLN